MDKSDYLLSTSKTVESDGVDGNCDNDGKIKWMGVKNRVDLKSKDEYARSVGWFVTKIGREWKSFSRLADALRACDAETVRRKDAETEKMDLNLPADYAFPKPLNACIPVYVGDAKTMKATLASLSGAGVEDTSMDVEEGDDTSMGVKDKVSSCHRNELWGMMGDEGWKKIPGDQLNDFFFRHPDAEDKKKRDMVQGTDYFVEFSDAAKNFGWVPDGGECQYKKIAAVDPPSLNQDNTKASNLPRRQTRSSSKSATGENDIITIDDSSDEEVSRHMFICSILGQSATN